MTWICTQSRRPELPNIVAIVCRTSANDALKLTGYFLEGNWHAIACPRGVTIVEVTHWCELPYYLPAHDRGDRVAWNTEVAA